MYEAAPALELTATGIHSRVVSCLREDGSMDSWGASLYGDPCRECGFDWSITEQAAQLQIAALPAKCAEIVPGATGAERHPDLAWSVGAYVCHVADNLRIWSERVGGATEGAGPAISAYDENLLAKARNYDGISLAAAQWSLRHAVLEYIEALDQAPRTGTLLIHPERGALTRADVLCANAHDATHHLWDIRRSLEAR
jgi:uncharacterized damage-inducible protein DinB